MGLLDKVKGILFDEEEIEIPEIKKDNKKVIKKNIEPIKEENPIKEIKIPKEDFSDKEYRSESTFTFPIDFEDEEPVKIEEKPKPRVQEIKEHNRQDRHEQIDRDFSDFLNKKDEKKKFTPTPIISPVYGVLDQNYKKEDVIVKKEVLRTPVEPTLDQVRKKAFGSLEDEIDANLTNTKEIKISEELTVKKEKKVSKKEKVEEPVDKLKTIGELIEEDAHSLEIPEIDSINEDLDEYNSDSDIIDSEPTKNVEDLLSEELEDNEIKEEDIIEEENDAEIDDEEADLFSLIDSMYEEKGE